MHLQLELTLLPHWLLVAIECDKWVILHVLLTLCMHAIPLLYWIQA